MIRIICTETDCSAMINIGGPLDIKCKTFDIKAPELEAFISEKKECINRTIVGVEVMPDKKLVKCKSCRMVLYNEQAEVGYCVDCDPKNPL